jgi:DNA-binding response OmpR family regulator
MKQAAKILIVEDETTLREVYTTLLGMQGYEVESAVNGLEGLTKHHAFQPDLIILDLLMPIMDGMTFLKNFDNAASPNTKILVYSNLYDSDTVDQVKQLGANDIILKSSLSPSQLIAAVSGLLS